MEERDKVEIEQIESNVRNSEIEIQFADVRQEDNELVYRLKEILQTDVNNLPSLRAIDSIRGKTETKKINEILVTIRLSNINNIRDVVKAAAILVSERVGVMRKKEQKQKAN